MSYVVAFFEHKKTIENVTAYSPRTGVFAFVAEPWRLSSLSTGATHLSKQRGQIEKKTT